MIRFGAAGNSNSFYEAGFKTTLQTPAYLAERGLNAFEYSFGRGVNMRSETGREIGEEMKRHGVEISVHAPYYINLCSHEQEKSFPYIMSSVKLLNAMGGKRCVVHSGSQGNNSREVALDRCRAGYLRVLEMLDEAGYDYILCPEAMGKFPQIGTYEEVTNLCKLSERMLPCFDFGHINCITNGGLKTKDDYRRIIDHALDTLGDRAREMHIHFSKIQFGGKGEIRHLTFADTVYGPEFAPLAEIIADYRLEPVIISESDGTQAEDAMQMKSIYNSLQKS